MRIKTEGLTDIALDWAAAKARGLLDKPIKIGSFLDGTTPHWSVVLQHYSPSTNELLSATLADEEGLVVESFKDRTDDWRCFDFKIGHAYSGNTKSIATTRCFVALKLGDEIDIPDEVIAEQKARYAEVANREAEISNDGVVKIVENSLSLDM